MEEGHDLGMRCSNCGTQNEAGRKFCLECGSRLNAPCPSCGTPNPPAARFCGECGTRLDAAEEARAAGPDGETDVAAARVHGATVAQRRLVTILFADLVGFTPFSEERDPEEVRGTLQRYFDAAREVIERYGGTVEKFIGDAVMAVWGTPTAHEDDAERAVRAALELVDAVVALGAGLQARAGVLTGEAAVTVGATDQGLVAGDLVNTAARLQSVAPPGAVLVGESTMHASSAAVAYEPAGEQAVRGRQEPIAAWRALRVVAQRGGALRSDTLETPFVGRDEEFRLLRDLLHTTGRDPRTRLVSITGPAGIGKSRLAWELEKYVDGVVELIYWHRGRCPAYGEGVTFWALGEMVRRRCRLIEGDDELTTRQRVLATVDEYVADETERAWIASALLALLGIEPSPQGGRELLFAAWRRFFEHIAARGPTVLVFEDLHWADSGLLDFIDHLVDWSKAAPLLVVTLARPELFDRRPNWGAGRRTYTAMALDPLSERDMRRMLAAIVPDLPDRAARAIVDRADGIPLYAVETLRMLLADGRLREVDGKLVTTGELGDVAIPPSLQSLITARLDSLGEQDRRLLQDAAVIGQSFTPTAIAAVSGLGPGEVEERLTGMVRRELLSREVDPRSPELGQYGFTQSLIREVAYSTLARPDRRARHLAAARHFEATSGDETAGVLASHYLAAHAASSPGPEADAVAAQARVALRAAADRAAALGSHEQAAGYFDQALGVTTDRSERAALLERQAAELDLAGRYERAEMSARAAIELHEASGDLAGAARGRGVLGTLLIHAQRAPDAISELQTAAANLPGDASPAVRADVLAKLARGYYRNLEPERSLEAVERALALAEHHSLIRTLAEAMVTKGTALTMLSRPREASLLLRGGTDIARREGDVPTALRGIANATFLVAYNDSGDEALKMVRDAIDLARAIGDLGQVVWHLSNHVAGSVYRGLPLQAALDEVDEVFALGLERADRLQLTHRYLWAAAMQGRDVTAEVAKFVDEVAVDADPQMRADAEELETMAAMARGDFLEASRRQDLLSRMRPDYAQSSYASFYAAIAGDPQEARRLLAVAETRPVVGIVGAGVRAAARAGAAALDGQRDEALAHFREAIRRLRQVQDMFDVGLAGLAMLRTLGPAEPEASAAGREAIEIFERMGAEPLVRQVRAALETSRAPVASTGAEAAQTGVEA